ncbi:Uncharacterized conserved protein YgbK, DUF1537 family [Clostridium sp. USBA 49]|uniref:four-carbon acid sugar kinase family protein n=1 Tax=Clostridium sp. USBA 49 TaxID=1881060 RepID=UPI0009995952|nr:four-carbon acid sugar kinase family protein [Clostridium sp. USBA 49]SKA87686.1 Uncharacterized conserved protein YgbK, DUF1537 family [Clostridium sp. USBA 49]
MCKLGVIADDLTGATTVGVLLARTGISTAAFFDSDKLDMNENYDAIVLSSDSRPLNKELARANVKKALNALKKQNAVYFSKRIDTTMRGGIGFEVDAMLEELDEDTIAVMVPAMPQSNRILVGGYSIINGVALSKTAVAKDVRTPINETHIPTLYSKQTNRKIGQVQLASILAGKEYVKKALVEEREKGSTVIIVDAVSLDDIELIAQSVLELEWKVLAIDPGPFTEKLAVLRGLGTGENVVSDKETIDISKEEGKVIVVAGSATPITKNQIQILSNKDYSSSISVDPLKLIEEKNSYKEINLKANMVLDVANQDKNKVLIIETAVTSDVLNLEEIEAKYNLQKGQAAEKINKGLGEIVKKVLDDKKIGKKVKGLYMTGGDTMVTTLRTIGANGIKLINYVIPQTDLGTIIGGQYEGLAIIGKGGLTGTENTAVDAVEMIYKQSRKKY